MFGGGRIDEVRDTHTRRDGRNRAYLVECLHDICGVMDDAIRLTSKHVRVVASVYNIVSLKKLESDTIRPLIHMPLPPILPTNFSPESIHSLPPCVQYVLDENKRKTLRDGLRGTAAGVVLLLWSSCGHPRRINALFRTLRNRTLEGVKAQDLFDDCERAMTVEFNVKLICSKVSKESIPNLLTGLFTLMQDLESQAYMDAIEATTDHYQIVPLGQGRYLPLLAEDILDGLDSDEECQNKNDKIIEVDQKSPVDLDAETVGHSKDMREGKNQDLIGVVGYLPFPAVRNLLRLYSSPLTPKALPPWIRSAIQEIVVAEEVMKTLLSNMRNSPDSKNREEVEKWPAQQKEERDQRSKQFERIMCATFALTFGLNGMNPDEHPLLRQFLSKNIYIQCSAMEKLHNIKNFPCSSIPEDLWDRIFKVGRITENDSVDELGVYFQPEDKYNVGWDSIYVLPLTGGGRVIIFEQDEEWFHDVSSCESGPIHVVSEFRWGRQHILEKTVSQRHQYSTLNNPFYDAFSNLKDKAEGPTEVVFMLVTPNAISWDEQDQMEEFLQKMNTTEKEAECRQAEPMDDELYVSVKGDMEHWCPTVAYASTTAFSLRGLIHDLT
eukprot:PhF_6_TR10051/c2_g3_i13/m.15509